MKTRERLRPAAYVVAILISLSMGASAIGLAGDPIESREVGGEWRSGSTMPFPLTFFDAALNPHDYFVFVPGGARPGGSIDGSILAFNPELGVWHDSGSDLVVPVAGYTANIHEDEQFIILLTFCGLTESSGYTDVVQWFNLTTGDVGTIPGQPYPGSVGCTAALNAVWRNKVVIAGGLGADPPYHPTETWIFDPDEAWGGVPWTQIPSAALTPARAYIMSAVVDDRVYAIGGSYLDVPLWVDVDTVQVLDPAASTPVWSTLAPLPEPCSRGRAWGFDSHSSVSAFGRPLAGTIVTTCGSWPDVNNHVYLYDTHTDTWEEFPSLGTARRGSAAEFIPVEHGVLRPGMPGIWVWGGVGGSGTVLDTSEFYELEPSMCSVLLVNDDPEFDPPSGEAAGVPYYHTALDILGVTFDRWDVPISGPPLAYILDAFDAVVWFTGSDRQEAVNLIEEASLVQYLDGGGTLILSAEDQVAAQGLTPLLTDYMSVGTVIQDVGLDVVEGTGPLYSRVPECPMHPPLIFGGAYWPGDLEDDTVFAGPGGFEALSYTANGSPAATRYDGGHFRTMYLGFPLEWVRTAKARSDLLGPMVRWGLCPLFEDSLESGNTLRWSVTVQ